MGRSLRRTTRVANSMRTTGGRVKREHRTFHLERRRFANRRGNPRLATSADRNARRHSCTAVVVKEFGRKFGRNWSSPGARSTQSPIGTKRRSWVFAYQQIGDAFVSTLPACLGSAALDSVRARSDPSGEPSACLAMQVCVELGTETGEISRRFCALTDRY
jgi:hypothetical protein